MNWYIFMNCFFIYSFAGWLFECVLLSIQERTIISDRGVMKGPFCPIYAIGALSLYILLKPFENNAWLLFIGGMILATALEYITAVIMIKMFGCLWWNYDNKPFNYKGILCLESTVAWGILTVMTFKVFQPSVERFISLYSFGVGRILVYIMALVYCLDFFTSIRFAKKPNAINAEQMDKRVFKALK